MKLKQSQDKKDELSAELKNMKKSVKMLTYDCYKLDEILSVGR